MRSLGRRKITKSISKKTIDLNNLELHCMVLQKFVCHTNWSKHFFSENAETKKFIGIIGLMSVNRLFAPTDYYKCNAEFTDVMSKLKLLKQLDEDYTSNNSTAGPIDPMKKLAR